MSTTSPALITAAELERMSFPDKQVELVRGKLVVREPPGSWHGRVAARLTLRVAGYVLERNLGEVFAQDTGFRIRADPGVRLIWVIDPQLAEARVYRADGNGSAFVPDLREVPIQVDH